MKYTDYQCANIAPDGINRNEEQAGLPEMTGP